MRILIAAVSMLALSAGAACAQQTTQQTPPAGGQVEAPATEAAFLKTMEEMIGTTVMGADGNEIGTVSDVIYDPEAKRARQLVVDTAEGRQVALDFDDAQLELDRNRISMDATTAEDVAGMEEFGSDQTEAGTSLKATGQGG